MSYYEFTIGLIIGATLTHAGAFAAGLWWNNRGWRKLRERLAD
jgi:hypothetical protein